MLEEVEVQQTAQKMLTVLCLLITANQ